MPVVIRRKAIFLPFFQLIKETDFHELWLSRIFFLVVLFHKDMEVYHQPDVAKGRNFYASALVSMPCCMK